jgi:ADP-ribose pyrophosphatase YjhB (NUDIX family)
MSSLPRTYPPRPIVGVGAVVVTPGGVVLVRRRLEPLAGQWNLPGGVVEVGETLRAAIVREVFEETSLIAEPGPIIDVFDRILYDEAGKVRYHYVLVEFLCRQTGGALQHGTDVSEAVVADPVHLDAYHLTPTAVAVIERGLAIARGESPGLARPAPNGWSESGIPNPESRPPGGS